MMPPCFEYMLRKYIQIQRFFKLIGFYQIINCIYGQEKGGGTNLIRVKRKKIVRFVKGGCGFFARKRSHKALVIGI